jgi:hypothetical protein
MAHHISGTRWGAVGDPLSSMLFLLIMEALSALIRTANNWSLLQPLGGTAIADRASLYANDLVMFLSPTIQDLQLTRCIFDLFHGASGLGCNLQKCQMVPIRCDDQLIQLATSVFPCQVFEFPVK